MAWRSRRSPPPSNFDFHETARLLFIFAEHARRRRRSGTRAAGQYRRFAFSRLFLSRGRGPASPRARSSASMRSVSALTTAARPCGRDAPAPSSISSRSRCCAPPASPTAASSSSTRSAASAARRAQSRPARSRAAWRSASANFFASRARSAASATTRASIFLSTNGAPSAASMLSWRAASRGPTSDTLRPSRPARAVRPARCTKSFIVGATS